MVPTEIQYGGCKTGSSFFSMWVEHRDTIAVTNYGFLWQTIQIKVTLFSKWWKPFKTQCCMKKLEKKYYAMSLYDRSNRTSMWQMGPFWFWDDIYCIKGAYCHIHDFLIMSPPHTGGGIIIWMAVSVCLSVRPSVLCSVPRPNSGKERKPKIGRMVTRHTGIPLTYLEVKRSRSPGRLKQKVE